MIDLIRNPPTSLTLSKSYLIDELRLRNWEAYVYYSQSSFMRLIRPDGKSLELYGMTPPTTTFPDGCRSNDKFSTYFLLKENRIPTPETFITSNLEEALECFRTYKVNNQSKTMVVKPLDSSHGNGVSTQVITEAQLKNACNSAKQFSDDILLQEEMPEYQDIRLTVVDYKVVGVVLREPATVYGDGKHTINELIQTENNQSDRGENYDEEKNKISIENASTFLGDSILSIPSIGSKIQVIGTANVGTGGTVTDVMEVTPEWLISLAEKTAKICNLPVCGVDILMNELNIDCTELSANPKVIEVNKSPSLFLSDMVNPKGENKVTKAFVDYLEKL